MAAARTCALGVALLMVCSIVHAENKERWSKPAKEAEGRSEWIPVAAPFRDSDVSASAQHEEVATVLRPPELGNIRQQRLVQTPRQGRGPPVGPQQYFPGDQSHLIRFPNEQLPPQLRQPQFQQNFHQPQFLPPQPVPAGFSPQALAQSSFQPQPIPAFHNQPVPVRPLNNSFIPAGPQEEVQLVYVPVEALQGQKVGSNKQKVQPSNQFNNNNPASRDQAFQDQLRQFVQQQGPKPLLSGQEQYQLEQQRLAQIREQEERQRIKDQERKDRQEQEEKLRKEQENKERQETEQRLRKEQELREQEVFRKIQADKDAKNREERERHEANLRFQQQQQQEFQQRGQEQFASPAPSLQAQENAFQQQLHHQAPTEPASPAPHQPPLAVYMSSPNRDPAAIEDVLFALRDAETIPVLDRVPSPQSTPPQVFVGPAEMTAPDGYTKFELPYLSSLEGNRVERKVDQLPFFVAPLSFNPPNGYSKIPFPHPHVGSVVVSHGRRPPSPQVSSDEYTSSELPSISPAIPLLVNSLQNGRGAKHQRPHVQQQFVDQQQFSQQEQQQFVPQGQQQFQQQEYVPFTPQYEEDQPITTDVPEPPPTLAAPTFSRRPLHSRGRPRQPAEVSTTPEPRRKAPARETVTPEPRPRGRRPGGRNRVTTPQPITEETYDSSREASHEQQPEVQQASPTPPQFEQQQFAEPQFNHQSFDPQAFPTYQGQFQHQQVFPANTVHQPAVQHNFNVPSNHATHTRGNFAAPTPTQVYEAEQESVSEQAEIDSSSYDNQRFEAPKKVGSNRHETPRPRQPEPTIAVSTEEPSFQRSRPTVFQPVVSSTPPSLLSRQSVSPFVSSTAYPSEAPNITPHHVVKGDVGKVKQQVNFPFIPTPLPDYPSVSEESQASPSPSPASPELEQHQFFVEPTTEVPTVAPTDEPQRTASPNPASLSYQTPSRPRGRVTQHSAEQAETSEPTRITPRPRVRPHTESSAEPTPSYQSSQRFRGRGQTSREEGSDEATSQQPAQRVRTRVHTGRGRVAHTTTTTESPSGLLITVPDDSQGETPVTRTRQRFRATGERVRGTGTRQQQITRGRQPARQQDNENLELTKPVRQQVGSASDTPVIDTPVYVPDVQFESGFVPAIDSQKSLPTSTEVATDVTTARPGRQRFNNFGTGTRGSRRQQARTTTSSQDTITDAPITSGRKYTVHTSRRQQTTPPPGTTGTRATGVRGRIRRPNSSTTTTTTTEAPEEEEIVVVPVSTGVTYIQNPYVTIQRPGNDPPSTANEVQEEEVQAAPVQSRFRQRPQPVDEDSYVDAPASRYDASPVEPEYQQYYSPSPPPSRITQRQDQQYFTASTPVSSQKPPRQLVATPAPQQFLREEPQQYHREEFEYQPQPTQRKHRPRTNNPGRYVALDDPEYGGEESQRSEQISIQQLEGAIAASLFNKALDAEVVDEEEGPENVELSEELEQKEQESVQEQEHEESESEVEHEEEEKHSTDENVTEQETTEQPMTTTSDEEVSQSAPVSAEPGEVNEKPALHAKPSEGRRRRIRIRTRKQQRPGDVFEAAESQNVASVAANLLNQQSILHDKQQINNNEWKLSLPNYPTLDLTSEGNIDDEENYSLNQDSDVDNIQFTTSDLPDHTEETKVAEVTTEETVAEMTTSVPEIELKTQKVTEGVTSTTEAPVTTVTEPMTAAVQTDDLSTQVETTTEFSVTTDTAAPPSTPRVLGTSTTTEISLETEICYRGRCVKTKVDADQMPIE